ncbi:MAG: proteinase [Acidimicrobiales bacterium]|nr:proteinase [Acidimicrobiales bacterium]
MSRSTTPAPIRRLALLLAVASLAAACSVTGGHASTSSSTTSTTTTAPPAGGPTTASGPGTTGPSGGRVAWSACDSGFQCGTVTVPLDYAKPNGDKIHIALARRPARLPSQRIGSLLMNPGGPGGSGIDMVEQIQLPSAIADRFDLVGFDPRGVGRSTATHCSPHLPEIYDVDPTIDSAAEAATYIKVSKSYVDDCARTDARLLPHLGTQNVARDLDELRKAVGDDKLSYLGYSYGTSIGQQYAQLFPTRIRAMVLDGVVDSETTGLAGADLQASGFERALAAFMADCAAKPSCPLGSDPARVIGDVQAAAEANPIPSANADRPATPGVITVAMGQGLYSRTLWTPLARALAAAKAGDGSGMVDLADAYLQRKADGSYSNAFDVYFAVSCIDSTWPKDPNAVLAAAKVVGRKYPHLGEALVNDYVRCALWPFPAQPLPAVTAPGSPPIVVISTTRDPATPYESGVKVAARLAHGVLVTNEGDGHTVFGQGKACIDGAVATYLTSLTPPTGLRCA